MEGKPVTVSSPRDAKALGMGLVPEDRKQEGLILRFSVGENITMAALSEIAKKGVLNRKKEKEIEKRQIENLLIKTPSAAAKVLNLSGGNQQKCVVGRWLELNPKVLILDEPTRGIDVGAKYEIYTIINDLVNQGKAVIVISSELPEVLGLSDRIYVMNEGKIIGELDAKKANQEVIMSMIVASK